MEDPGEVPGLLAAFHLKEKLGRRDERFLRVEIGARKQMQRNIRPMLHCAPTLVLLFYCSSFCSMYTPQLLNN